jgi:hypothetical protein
MEGAEFVTDTEINTAIAERCGFEKPFYTVHDIQWGGTNPGTPVWKLPNYCTDLNAMHEAECRITVIQMPEWVTILSEIAMKQATYSPHDHAFFFAHATARQRAEAFLRMFGLWREQNL